MNNDVTDARAAHLAGAGAPVRPLFNTDQPDQDKDLADRDAPSAEATAVTDQGVGPMETEDGNQEEVVPRSAPGPPPVLVAEREAHELTGHARYRSWRGCRYSSSITSTSWAPSASSALLGLLYYLLQIVIVYELGGDFYIVLGCLVGL